MENTVFVDVPVVDQWHIPDDLWDIIALLLPEHKNTHRFGGGRPRTPDRVCMEAILFVLRTGCQWKALNATRFCPSSTAHDRFQEWVKAGVFQEMWKLGLMAYDDWQGIDWKWLSMDGCMTKAPLGGEKDGQKPDRSGQARRQGSLLVDGNGIPIGLAVDGANRNDMKMARATLESIPADAARPQPDQDNPQNLCLDKGYDFDEVREIAKEFQFTAAHSCAWRGSPEDQTEGSGQSTAVGGGTDTQLDESVSRHIDTLEQKARKLHCNAPYGFCFHHIWANGVIRIGSKFTAANSCPNS